MNTRSTAPLEDLPAIKHNLSEGNIAGAKDEVSLLLGPGGIISSLDERHARSNTPWSHAKISQSPNLVVLPSSTSDVSAILTICSRRRIPVTAFCGGTSFSGSLTATRGGICIDFRRMNKIITVHEDDMDVVVQPAVGWQDLNAELEGHRLFFPPDPGPGARIGGMVGIYDFYPGVPEHVLTERFADRNELLRNQCLPLRHDERVGDIHDCRTRGRYSRQNAASTPEVVRRL